MKNSKGHGKSWKVMEKPLKSRGQVTHNVVFKIFTTALRNSVMNVSSECIDNYFHYYNQLDLLLLILVYWYAFICHVSFISGKI